MNFVSKTAALAASLALMAFPATAMAKSGHTHGKAGKRGNHCGLVHNKHVKDHGLLKTGQNCAKARHAATRAGHRGVAASGQSSAGQAAAENAGSGANDGSGATGSDPNAASDTTDGPDTPGTTPTPEATEPPEPAGAPEPPDATEPPDPSETHSPTPAPGPAPAPGDAAPTSP